MLVVNTKLVAVAVLLLVIAVMVWYNSKDKNVEGFFGPTRHPMGFNYEGSTSTSNCKNDKIRRNCDKYNTSGFRLIRNLRRRLCNIHSKQRCNRTRQSQPATVQAVQPVQALPQGSVQATPVPTNLSDETLCPEYTHYTRFTTQPRCPNKGDLPSNFLLQTTQNRVNKVCNFKDRKIPCLLDNGSWLGGAYPGQPTDYHQHRESYLTTCKEYYNKMCGNTEGSMTDTAAEGHYTKRIDPITNVPVSVPAIDYINNPIQ